MPRHGYSTVGLASVRGGAVRVWFSPAFISRMVETEGFDAFQQWQEKERLIVPNVYLHMDIKRSIRLGKFKENSNDRVVFF